MDEAVRGFVWRICLVRELGMCADVTRVITAIYCASATDEIDKRARSRHW
jgi:hypothetical protein